LAPFFLSHHISPPSHTLTFNSRIIRSTMRPHPAWSSDQLTDAQNNPIPVNALVYSPNGNQLIVASGNSVLIYDAIVGEMTKRLKGHKNTVYCLAYSRDGKQFVSGGADNQVIIWSSKGEGKLRYPHNDSIQCLACNPITMQLVSCTESDFGLWSPEHADVKKFKVSSKILCCSWTNDGQHLALGHFSGTISIRDRDGREKLKIQRNAPVWCMQWNPSREKLQLAVGCWDQTLSFYHLSGQQIGRDYKLDYDPCSVAHFSNGEYLIIGGSDKSATLWKHTGPKLVKICDESNWVWAIAHRPNHNFVAVGTEDGRVKVYHLMFSTVHGLHEDHYAYRDLMTEVVVQDLVTDKKTKIECKDYVKKIAMYRARLAVQLPERVHIYDIYQDEREMRFRLHSRIMKKFDCNLLVVTSSHIILCFEKSLQLYNFHGIKEREWSVDSLIRYIKVIGGPPLREALLVGLKNGSILKLFIDNPFPIQLLKHSVSIRCLDLSLNRDKLALVDEKSNIMVYHLKERRFIFQDSNANSVAWNSAYDDMLCYSGSNVLSIKTSDFPVHQHKFKGFVVGFNGSKIFGLHIVSMSTIDIPQSISMYRYIERKDFQNAYRIACLGVTESDWKILAFQALMGLDFDVARNSFIRLRDVKYVSLLNKFEQDIYQHKYNEHTFLGEIYAYQGKFSEAAEKFVQAGEPKKAIDMLCDLRKWEEARALAQKMGRDSGIDVNELIKRQAHLAEDDGDMLAAGKLYIACNEYSKAIKILGENKWLDDMAEVLAGFNPETDRQFIKMCADYFLKFENYDYAQVALEKLGDFESLIELHSRSKNWEYAFALLEEHPQFKKKVYVPYARHLAENDKFDEAMAAFIDAGEPEEAVKMIELLSHNAVLERRFKDAAYYFFLLALKNLEMNKYDMENAADTLTDAQKIQMRKRVQVFYRCKKLSSLYYSYHHIHEYSELPFNSMPPKYLFNMARFLLMNMGKQAPYGVNRTLIVTTLAKLSTMLEHYKLSREAYQRLGTLRVPAHLQSEIDLSSISINAKPITNNEEDTPICFRCSTSNQLLQREDKCSSCQHPFIRSFSSFDHLPLVEFTLPPHMPHEEAMTLISKDVLRSSYKNAAGGGDGWQEQQQDGAETLTFDNGPPQEDMDAQEEADPFSQLLLSANQRTQRHEPVQVTGDLLKAFDRNTVFVEEWPSDLVPRRYYKCLFSDHQIAQCKTCNLFFQAEDFEFALLKTNNTCPLCRTKQKVKHQHVQ